MSYNITPSSNWCIVKDSTKLRTAIKFRINQIKIPVAQLATGSNLDPDKIYKYLRGSKNSMSQFKILKLASYLGIEVDLRVDFKT